METKFPGLTSTGYEKKSPATIAYNCIAWAANFTDLWWEPIEEKGYYWPYGVPSEYTLDALIEVYKKFGFKLCDNGNYEDGFEKIAIYGIKDIYTHAARQLDNGKWTSKIGMREDIEHSSLAGLEGEMYGQVKHFMKREKP